MDKSTLLNPEQAEVIQAFGSLKPAHLGLRDDVRHRSVAMLNRLSAAMSCKAGERIGT